MAKSRNGALAGLALGTVVSWLPFMQAGLRLLLRSQPPSARIPLLVYSDVVRYFAEERPDDARIACGAMLVRPGHRGLTIFLAFLDDQKQIVRDANEQPYGRCMLAAEVDDELRGLLADSELLLFA